MARHLVPLSILTLVALCAALPACVGPNTGADDAARPPRTRQSAADLAPAESFEIRFGSELAGYLIDVLPMPAGAADTRAYDPGTALIESHDHTLLGFISPHGTTYRFNESGEPKTVAFGSRTASIAAFFRKNDAPTLIPIKS